MFRKINFTSISIFSFLFFVGSCNQGDLKTQKPADKKNAHLVTHNSTPDTILVVSMAFNEGYLIAPITNKITAFYHIPVKYMSSALPAYAYFKERNRYKADSLLNYLATLNSGRYRFVAGLTSKDISTTNGSIPDWGIFGLGSLTNKGCVTSSFRLKRNALTSLLTERIQKVVLHEIGHNYGLEHCTSLYPCFMKDANGKISEVDDEPMEMCKALQKKN